MTNSWIRKRVDRILFRQPLQPLVWWWYYSPDSRQPSVEISESARVWLAELQTNGIVVLPGKFPDVADYLEREYFAPLEKGSRPAHPLEDAPSMPIGRDAYTGTYTGQVSFRDAPFAPVLFDADLTGVVYNYYRRQPFYRNQPVIGLNDTKLDADPAKEVSTKFHVDHFRQVSFMLLANDVSKETTHLQYAKKSHLERHDWDRFEYSDESVEKRYEVLDAVGPKGTLIIFDAGAGLHRGVYVKGTKRKFLHTNLNTGYQLSDLRIDSADGWDQLPKMPERVRRMVAPLLETRNG